MRVPEVLITEIKTKHGNPCSPYLSVTGLLLSIYGCDDKSKLTICRSNHLEVFYKKNVLKSLPKFTGNYQLWCLFNNVLYLQPST